MGGVDVYLRGQEIHSPAVAGPLVPQVMDDMWVGWVFILEDWRYTDLQ